jgi:hypothetical protein
MAMDPGTMQQMLMQKLQQQPQSASAGGGFGSPPMQGNTATPGGIGAQVAQKLMLMKALQNSQAGQQQQVAQGMLPGTNAQLAADPTMQALQQPPQLPPMQFPPGGPSG